jgi:hypothetical protein
LIDQPVKRFQNVLREQLRNNQHVAQSEGTFCACTQQSLATAHTLSHVIMTIRVPLRGVTAVEFHQPRVQRVEIPTELQERGVDPATWEAAMQALDKGARAYWRWPFVYFAQKAGDTAVRIQCLRLNAEQKKLATGLYFELGRRRWFGRESTRRWVAVTVPLSSTYKPTTKYRASSVALMLASGSAQQSIMVAQAGRQRSNDRMKLAQAHMGAAGVPKGAVAAVAVADGVPMGMALAA